jgi:hypothetical protein
MIRKSFERLGNLFPEIAGAIYGEEKGGRSKVIKQSPEDLRRRARPIADAPPVSLAPVRSRRRRRAKGKPTGVPLRLRFLERDCCGVRAPDGDSGTRGSSRKVGPLSGLGERLAGGRRRDPTAARARIGPPPGRSAVRFRYLKD